MPYKKRATGGVSSNMDAQPTTTFSSTTRQNPVKKSAPTNTAAGEKIDELSTTLKGATLNVFFFSPLHIQLTNN